MSISYFDPECFCPFCEWVGNYDDTIPDFVQEFYLCPICGKEVRDMKTDNNMAKGRIND